jgi:hypothetical protein
VAALFVDGPCGCGQVTVMFEDGVGTEPGVPVWVSGPGVIELGVGGVNEKASVFDACRVFGGGIWVPPFAAVTVPVTLNTFPSVWGEDVIPVYDARVVLGW